MPRRNNGPRLKWLAKRKCWYITWTEHGRSRERSLGTVDRDEAEIRFAEWLQNRGHRGGPRDPAQVFVTEILIDYQMERGPKVAAPSRIGYAVAPLVAFWEGNTVADVTPQACARYGEQRQRSAGTVRRELGVLRAAINYGHRSGRLTRTVPVELPERPESRDRWLTRREVAALLRCARTPQARLYMPLWILIALYTGRRKEAILSLRWPQVDLEAGRIDFEVPGRRRTAKKRGVVRIPPRLLPHLRRARARGTELGYVVHEHGKRIGNIRKGFAGACARADAAAERAWNRAEAAAATGRAGLPRPAALSGTVTPHTLRHTCATWLMQAGTDRWEVAGFLSMSMETLERVYGHAHPDHMLAAAEAIGRRPGA